MVIAAIMENPKRDASVIILFQLCLLVLFWIFATYKKNDVEGDEKYPMFQDVHVMIFIGFGFLMTFLRRYGYSAVGFNFLLGALVIQWATLCQGFYELNENYHMEIGIKSYGAIGANRAGSMYRVKKKNKEQRVLTHVYQKSLYAADIAAAAVLISMGAVLGRTSYIQLLTMGAIEIAVFSANSYLGLEIFKVTDAGGSIFVHTFGAYFGLGVSYILGRRKDKSAPENALEEARYTSDLFAMIGTVFLWLYWPSFNAIELTGDEQHRAVINTYLSLAACCVTTFAISLLMTEDHKFDMVHVQNSTLAGGVAVGAAANLMLEPFGAVICGILAGCLSVYGYAKLTPWIASNVGLKDTCGVHNLHGMPGVFAGLVAALMAGIATEKTYNMKLYEIFPARALPNMTATVEYNFLKPGDGRSAGEQAGYQVLALIVTLTIAIASGLVTGFIISFSKLDTVSVDNFHDDTIFWNLPDHGVPQQKFSESCSLTRASHFDNPSFEPNTQPSSSSHHHNDNNGTATPTTTAVST